MREPEVWEAKNAIGPVPGSPEQNGLRNKYYANQIGYQYHEAMDADTSFPCPLSDCVRLTQRC